ncbi:MAG TPA: aminotransferase class I/II-fold pyridoxal phosphate-dependent enzyme, partial [Candidatus Companilactobacillus pullicola]|nr:aminotransferase class I/II-fold pyridoxal phosphate-dependent enzyme [Candidatus Companilactobacillus pullicola]
QSFVDEVVAKNAIERAKYEELFQKLGLKFYHSQANFIFFKADSAQELAQVLLKNGYLIRTGLRPSWLRLSIGTPDDNLKIQKIITDFFAING